MILRPNTKFDFPPVNPNSPLWLPKQTNNWHFSIHRQGRGQPLAKLPRSGVINMLTWNNFLGEECWCEEKWIIPMTGSNGILFLLVLYLQPGCYRSQCRSQNDYSNKGLEPQSLPPYANEEIVPYTCRYGRQMPNNSPTSLKCVNGRYNKHDKCWLRYFWLAS